MIKTFLILIITPIFLLASQQIILVVADDVNTSKAKLECYEGSTKVFATLDVNIGKKGLGWGLGQKHMLRKVTDPVKKEGDKKAPIGIFKLTSLFGYAKEASYKMPYQHAHKNLICVDDSSSTQYNQIIQMPLFAPKSFEHMKRDDLQYELGIVVEHNKQAKSQAGSCIFIHVQKAKNEGTAGCTAMKLSEVTKIAKWLDPTKTPLLIQIPKYMRKNVLALYPQLSTSKLLTSHPLEGKSQ